MSKICFGCGAKLQSTNKESEGFIPEQKLEESKYCQRCFRMIHYGENRPAKEPKSTTSIINTVNKNAEFAVFMVDFINIFDDVMAIYKRIKVPKVLVISKSDIIPKNVSFSQIKNYLKIVYNITGDIIFTSNKSNLNTFIKCLYGKKEAYFLGLTNSGKSTLLNSLIEKFGGTATTLTTSYKENTTQDFVRIKLKGLTLIDSPGFVIENFELNKDSNITNEIHPITYQNKIKSTYKLDKLFDITIKGNINAVFYFSKNIKINRIYNNDIQGITFKVRANSDIVICGLGFIKITDDTEIIIKDELMKFINIRPSLVGGIYE